MVEKFEAPQVCLPVPADDVRGNVVSLRRMARNTGRCFIMGVMLYMTMSMVIMGVMLYMTMSMVCIIWQ